MPDFKLPDLGEGVTEAEVDTWLVEEGDEVAEDDLIVEVITDKATAEIPSPYEGTITKIHVAAGAIVPVGTVLISIGEAAPSAQQGTTGQDTPAEGAVPAGNRDITQAPRTAPAPESESRADDRSGAVKAMPPVRRLARRLDVDITSVAGSGPGGRIVRDDVVVASRGNGAERAAPDRMRSAPATPSGGRREPLRGVRRVIAERMSEAHRIVPSVTHVEECDVTELEATRKLANERSPQATRLTFLPFVVKAAIVCLRDYPALNASLDEAAGEIVYHDSFDIGVAVDTPSGLMVPVVKGAADKTLRELAADIDGLAERARAGSLGHDELTGSTFTITSPGRFGGLMASPIVFHPQSAILGVHRAGDRPVVRDGQVVARRMMNLSITFDHRILDGMTAARAMLDLVRLLEHPAVLAIAD